MNHCDGLPLWWNHKRSCLPTWACSSGGGVGGQASIGCSNDMSSHPVRQALPSSYFCILYRFLLLWWLGAWLGDQNIRVFKSHPTGNLKGEIWVSENECRQDIEDKCRAETLVPIWGWWHGLTPLPRPKPLFVHIPVTVELERMVAGRTQNRDEELGFSGLPSSLPTNLAHITTVWLRVFICGMETLTPPWAGWGRSWEEDHPRVRRDKWEGVSLQMWKLLTFESMKSIIKRWNPEKNHHLFGGFKTYTSK